MNINFFYLLIATNFKQKNNKKYDNGVNSINHIMISNRIIQIFSNCTTRHVEIHWRRYCRWWSFHANQFGITFSSFCHIITLWNGKNMNNVAIKIFFFLMGGANLYFVRPRLLEFHQWFLHSCSNLITIHHYFCHLWWILIWRLRQFGHFFEFELFLLFYWIHYLRDFRWWWINIGLVRNQTLLTTSTGLEGKMIKKTLNHTKRRISKNIICIRTLLFLSWIKSWGKNLTPKKSYWYEKNFNTISIFDSSEIWIFFFLLLTSNNSLW